MAAMLAGAMVGLFNGFFVAKVKVDSFIVTLATMIIVQGIVFKICGGGTLISRDFSMAAIIESPLLNVLSPRILFTVFVVVAFEFFLKMTQWGRGFYMVGANRSTAWHAGLRVDGYVISAFILSGAFQALAAGCLVLPLTRRRR